MDTKHSTFCMIFYNIYVNKCVCLGTRKKTVYETRVEIASAAAEIYCAYITHYYIPTHDIIYIPSKRNPIRMLSVLTCIHV